MLCIVIDGMQEKGICYLYYLSFALGWETISDRLV